MVTMTCLVLIDERFVPLSFITLPPMCSMHFSPSNDPSSDDLPAIRLRLYLFSELFSFSISRVFLILPGQDDTSLHQTILRLRIIGPPGPVLQRPRGAYGGAGGIPPAEFAFIGFILSSVKEHNTKGTCIDASSTSYAKVTIDKDRLFIVFRPGKGVDRTGR